MCIVLNLLEAPPIKRQKETREMNVNNFNTTPKYYHFIM